MKDIYPARERAMQAHYHRVLQDLHHCRLSDDPLSEEPTLLLVELNRLCRQLPAKSAFPKR